MQKTGSDFVRVDVLARLAECWIGRKASEFVRRAPGGQQTVTASLIEFGTGSIQAYRGASKMSIEDGARRSESEVSMKARLQCPQGDQSQDVITGLKLGALATSDTESSDSITLVSLFQFVGRSPERKNMNLAASESENS